MVHFLGNGSAFYTYSMKNRQDIQQDQVFIKSQLDSLENYNNRLESKLTDDEGEYLYNVNPDKEWTLFKLLLEIEEDPHPRLLSS